MISTASDYEPKAENPYSDQVYPTIRFTKLDVKKEYCYNTSSFFWREKHNVGYLNFVEPGTCCNFYHFMKHMRHICLDVVNLLN